MIVFYTFQVRTCILKILSDWKKKISMIFGLTSYYIFNLENIGGQCYNLQIDE